MRTRPTILSVLPLLILLGACGGTQQATGPASTEALSPAVSTLLAHEAPAAGPPLTAARPDHLLASIPDEPLGLLVLDAGAILGGLADGSLLHGLPFADDSIRTTLHALIDTIVDAALSLSPDPLDLRPSALDGLVVAAYRASTDGGPAGSNDEPDTFAIVMALPAAVLPNLEQLDDPPRQMFPHAVLDDVLLLSTLPGFDPAEGPRLDPDTLDPGHAPADAAVIALLPDVQRLTIAERFLVWNRLGGRVDRISLHVGIDGAANLHLVGGGGATLHQHLAALVEDVDAVFAEVASESEPTETLLRILVNALLSRISVHDQPDGGIHLHVPPPDCGGALRNAGVLALVAAAFAVPDPQEGDGRFSPPEPPPTTGCTGLMGHPALATGLLTRVDPRPGAGQDLYTAFHGGALALELATTGLGVLPMRIAPDHLHEPVAQLLGTRDALDPQLAVELLGRVPTFDDGMSEDALVEFGAILRLPTPLLDLIPFFLLATFGADLVEHAEYGTLLVYGMQERLDESWIENPRLSALLDAFGGDTRFVIASGPADPEDPDAELFGPPPAQGINMRLSGGFWLQFNDWPDGGGPAAAERLADAEQSLGPVLDAAVEAMIEGMMSELVVGIPPQQSVIDSAADGVRDALVQWVAALYGEPTVLHVADTTIQRTDDERFVQLALTTSGLGIASLVFLGAVGARVGKDEDAPIAPAEVFPPFEGATDDVF
ncbi:MAG: hypothetical protein EA398_03855 [Deltaproteobacteria bacterium]|nr:MAG: hypothetical protein EA398_03855 [Deltaproteobacteria bacterium]